MIKNLLVPELERRFPNRGLRLGTSDGPVATFPAMHPDVGDVTIYDDRDEATVAIGKITHTHINPYDESLPEDRRDAWVVDAVCDFLVDLFSDKVLFWVSESGQRVTFEVLDEPRKPKDMKRGGRYLVWSGPVTPE
jgi:hypothetical protein